MKVLKTFSNEIYGAGCKTINDISLVELCGDYVVLEFQKILFRNGWRDEISDITVHDNSGGCYKHAETVYNALVKAHGE